MTTLIGVLLSVWMLGTVLFLVLGPALIADKRNTKLSTVYVFAFTLLTLPTILGWPIILAYSLFGETKET